MHDVSTINIFCFIIKDFRTRLVELAEVIYGLIFIAYNIIFIFDVSYAYGKNERMVNFYRDSRFSLFIYMSISYLEQNFTYGRCKDIMNVTCKQWLFVLWLLALLAVAFES